MLVTSPPFDEVSEPFEDSAKLEGVFGRWPPFHDAAVLRAVLDRSGTSGPAFEVTIHVFEMTNEVDVDGFYVQRSHTEVTLRFDDIKELKLEAFNRQNVLAGLTVSRFDRDGRARLRVAMPSSFGMDASFECARATVVHVRPMARE